MHCWTEAELEEWLLPQCGTGYDVYFDTTNPPTTLICDNVENPACDPGPLDCDKTYYWQVVAAPDLPGGGQEGPIWSFSTPSGPDCNGNLQADTCDIIDGFSEDCQPNNIPDECEMDCQPNNIPDDCDIIAGAPDCDNNSVPDVCDPDADMDGVVDGCDICAGGDDNVDADMDGVPNFCDICAGGDDNADADGDTVPDFCDICAGGDDNADADGDTVPDFCDNCSLPNTDQADCQPNGTGDVCDIDSEKSEDLNENNIPDECEFSLLRPRAENGATQLNKGTATVASCMKDADCRVAPQHANAQIFCIPDDAGGLPGTCYVAKNRYISIAPNPGNAGLMTARRVSMDVNGNGTYEAGTDLVLGWVVAPVTSRNATGEPSPQMQSTIDPIAIPPSAYYVDWTVSGGFATSIVHLGDNEICPGRTYLVQEIILGQDVTSESSYSDATKFPTVARWGDVLGAGTGLSPQNVTNFGDALGIIQGFSAAQSVSKVWLDLEPASPNFAAVGFPDVLRCTQAIASQPYPFLGCP